MFQSVRPNSNIYILHKDNNPRIVIGTLTNQPVARRKYQVTPNFTQPQEMVVDLNVRSNNFTYNLVNIPSNLDIAETVFDGETILISDNKEAMNAEVLSLKQKSIDIVNSVDYHNNFINVCDSILSDLNPEFAEKQAQKQEIDMLKSQMSEMARKYDQLMEANRRLIGQLSKKEE